jgi:hypothetical protein
MLIGAGAVGVFGIRLLDVGDMRPCWKYDVPSLWCKGLASGQLLVFLSRRLTDGRGVALGDTVLGSEDGPSLSPSEGDHAISLKLDITPLTIDFSRPLDYGAQKHNTSEASIYKVLNRTVDQVGACASNEGQ